MILEKLMERVEFDPFGGCWLWSGVLLYERYPQIKLAKNVGDLAARTSWQIINGPIPTGLAITPTCGVLQCINPLHLAAVPRKAAVGVRANASRAARIGTLRQRLAASTRLDPATGCVEWTGRLNASGYGEISVSNRTQRVHRIAYEIDRGPIPDGLVLDHLCRNRRCCNPDHLEPVSPGENVKRGQGFAATNAAKTHCVNGHPFDDANTFWRGSWRGCRACRIEGARRSAEKRGPAQ